MFVKRLESISVEKKTQLHVCVDTATDIRRICIRDVSHPPCVGSDILDFKFGEEALHATRLNSMRGATSWCVSSMVRASHRIKADENICDFS